MNNSLTLNDLSTNYYTEINDNDFYNSEPLTQKLAPIENAPSILKQLGKQLEQYGESFRTVW